MAILKDVLRDPDPDGQSSGSDGGTGNDTALATDSTAADSTDTAEADSSTPTS
jgi:hypothetical protein